METDIFNIISIFTTHDIAKQHADFCDWVQNDKEYNHEVTSQVFANLHFKKQLAQKIVNSVLYGNYGSYSEYDLMKDSMDSRLRSLIKYYLSVEILGNPDLPEETIRKAFPNFSRNPWIKGWSILDISDEAIVKMRPCDPLYQGYRFFVINMLCFTSDRFILGFRTDSGPVRSPMKYYKGCKPLGIKASSAGVEWNTILFDRSLSDDHIAIFSNMLDGEGAIEICDWLSDYNQRVIFRSSY